MMVGGGRLLLDRLTMGYDGRAEPSRKRPRPRRAGANATTNSPGPRSPCGTLFRPVGESSQLTRSIVFSSGARSFILPSEAEVAAVDRAGRGVRAAGERAEA